MSRRPRPRRTSRAGHRPAARRPSLLHHGHGGRSRHAWGALSYLGDLVPVGVRRSGIGGHESAEGRARGGSDEALAERRGNAPPDGPGKHGGAGGGGLAGVTVRAAGGRGRRCGAQRFGLSCFSDLRLDASETHLNRCSDPERPVLPRSQYHQSHIQRSYMHTLRPRPKLRRGQAVHL